MSSDYILCTASKLFSTVHVWQKQTQQQHNTTTSTTAIIPRMYVVLFQCVLVPEFSTGEPSTLGATWSICGGVVLGGRSTPWPWGHVMSVLVGEAPVAARGLCCLLMWTALHEGFVSNQILHFFLPLTRVHECRACVCVCTHVCGWETGCGKMGWVVLKYMYIHGLPFVLYVRHFVKSAI